MGVKGGSNSSSNSSVGQNTGQSNGANASVGVNYGQTQSGNQSNSSGSSFNASSQDVWGAQSPHLENVYNGATDQYGQAIGQINDMQPMVQDQVSGAFNQGQQGFGNQVQGGFAQGLQGQVGPNSYVDSLAGDMMSDAQKIKAQNLQGLDARAAAAGMSGSSGYHDANNKMANNVDEATMQGMNQLRFNAHNQGVQNQMNLAGMMDRNQQFGVANTGAMQQNAMNQFNPAMAGLNATGMYGQIIGGPTTLTQSSGGSSNSSSSSGFSDSVNYGMNQSGGYTGSNNYGSNVGQGASNGWNANAGFSYV